MIRYELPRRWIIYDANAIMAALVEAKAAVQALTTLPYQKSWVEALQQLQLKREVAGTSRIEGAEFRRSGPMFRRRSCERDLSARRTRQCGPIAGLERCRLTFRSPATLCGKLIAAW